ncbi:USP6 N-terminal-like protein [Dissostichus eleginoides]|uniref:USP6 N-terminal-like protein n=1 Tax=Dissostichus eleginoides TaxID=100907 RepID=A0AAD9FHQ1_DISEL|nr:USP6 N-terminal-like protein [Dissostichus eleginoides]
MRLWRVRGQQWDTPALCHVWLDPSSLLLSPGEHAGPSDRQGAGVAVQTQGSGKIWRKGLFPQCKIFIVNDFEYLLWGKEATVEPWEDTNFRLYKVIDRFGFVQ